jgi:hypothetical protein
VTTPRYTSFKTFYPFYLSQHSNPWCRRLHFVGTGLVIWFFIVAMGTQQWNYLIAMPVAGYFFAWLGHFFIEKNKPATIKYPFYSLVGDFVMFKDMLIGKVSF